MLSVRSEVIENYGILHLLGREGDNTVIRIGHFLFPGLLIVFILTCVLGTLFAGYLIFRGLVTGEWVLVPAGSALMVVAFSLLWLCIDKGSDVMFKQWERARRDNPR